MRILFMGSADLACPCLDRLLAALADKVVGIVTQPDRPKGRSLHVAPCPVRAHVAERGIPVWTPENVNTPDSLACLSPLAPDLVVVVAYGQLLKAELLALAPLGCINVHASLLPRYRGAAPIQWAIANGETVTGVTTMHLNARMDAGDIIDQAAEPIRPDDTAASLQARLGALGADVLARTLDGLRTGTAPRRPQREAEVTFAPRLRKRDGRIRWEWPADQIRNRVRGFYPWPGCFCDLPGAGCVRVAKSRIEPGAGAAPGTVLANTGEGPLIQAGREALRLLEIQPQGRRAMAGSDFLRGHPIPLHARCPQLPD